MAGAVVTGDTGPVEHHHHRQAVQADIEVRLVEGPAEERGVHRHHRAHPGHGHARRGGHRVLLGDADIDEPLREARFERQEPGGPGHGRGDRHDAGVDLRLAEE